MLIILLITFKSTKLAHRHKREKKAKADHIINNTLLITPCMNEDAPPHTTVLRMNDDIEVQDREAMG